MTRIKRIYVQGHPYFITSVMYRRRPILVDNIDLYWHAIETIKAKTNFDLIAWVILPEHFHFMINLEGQNISSLLQRVKLSFSVEYQKRCPGSNRVWQSSFWDHIIRDEDDYIKHLHYIHLNPVKHGYVINPFNYPHSSILKFKDFYGDGCEINKVNKIKGDFGE